MTALQDSPTLDDCGLALSEWIGSILPGLELALAEVGDGDWGPGTREAVLRAASGEMIEQFANGEWERTTSDEILDREARLHLGRYAVARARAHVFKNRARG